jgi:hypothetical protein
MREVSAETLTLRAIQHPASSSPIAKQPFLHWTMRQRGRGRKQLVAFERNLSSSQKHGENRQWILVSCQ